MKKKKAKKKRSTKNITPKKLGKKKLPEKKEVAKKKPKTNPAPKRQPTKEERKHLDKEKSRARDYLGDKRKTSQLLDEAVRRAKRNKAVLKKVWAELLALFSLIRAWLKGEYPRYLCKQYFGLLLRLFTL